MAKILVGRDNPREVNIGVSFPSVAQVKTDNAEAKEELAEETVESEQVESVEESDDAPAEAQETAPKRRGKKRSKA